VRGNDEGVPEEKQSAGKGVGRNEASAAIVHCVRNDEIQWMGSAIIAEMRVLVENESSNSWTSWRSGDQRNHLVAHHPAIGWSKGSCSSGYQPQSVHQQASGMPEGYSTSNEFWKVPSRALWRDISNGREWRSRLESPCHPLTPYSHPHRTRSKPGRWKRKEVSYRTRDARIHIELTISLSPGNERVSGCISKPFDGNETYVVIPLNSRLEFGQAEMNLNAEHDRPVLLPTLTRHGLGTRRQWRQISSHETQGREVV